MNAKESMICIAIRKYANELKIPEKLWGNQLNKI